MTRRPRPPVGLGDVLRYCQEVDQYLAEIEPREAPDILINRTTRGITRTPVISPSGGTSTSSSLQFKGFWTPGVSYGIGDIVIVDSYAYPDQAGTYILSADAPAGSAMPGIDGSRLAAGAAHATLSGGGVASIVVDSGGLGYFIGQPVSLSGSGTGATGHISATDGGSTLGVVTTITVDTPGSGYASPPTVDLPLAYGWSEFARGHWTVLQIDNSPAGIIIDSTGVVGGSGSPEIKIMNDLGSEAAGSVLIRLSDIAGKVCKFNELVVCEETGAAFRLVLCSDAYDTSIGP